MGDGRVAEWEAKMTENLPGAALASEARGETSRARVLIVDDHAFMRVGVKAVLGGDASLEVVGEAQDGQEALECCRKLRPDLILMDVSMPRVDGIEATRRIKAEFPRTGVLVLTAHADHGLLLEAVKAGAAGYLLKAGGTSHVLDAVRAVLEGETTLDPEETVRLMRDLALEEGPRGGPLPGGSPLASRKGAHEDTL